METKEKAVAQVNEVIPRYALTASETKCLDRAARILRREFERGPILSNPETAGAYFKCRLNHGEREIFAAMFLDNRHKMIAYEELFHGTIDGCEVHVREVARRALHHNASAVIVAHNHPSGNREPSAADRAVTARIKQGLSLIDMRLLDHFVIADGPAVSLAAKGWV